MSRRIKVTGYINTLDLNPDDLDLSHPMGVSDDFYNEVSTGQRELPSLEEIEFELDGDID